MKKIKIGDTAYWEDPDEGLTSDMVRIVSRKGDHVTVVRKDDDCHFFVLDEELTAIEDSHVISAARLLFEEEGRIEIDADAKISRADGNPEFGAYVQAWVWVPDSDAARFV